MLEYIDEQYQPKDEVIAEYYVEPNGITLEEACEHLAAESSIGTWTDVSTMNQEIATSLKPHVYSIDKERGIVKIAYCTDLFELGNVPCILSSIAGNIYGMKIVRNLRLLDIHFPKKVVQSFPGPAFGIEGIRKLTRIPKRPLVGTIVKPKVGLTSTQHAKVAYDAWMGGLDIVKDDENLTDQPFNRFSDRIRETLKMRDLAEKETGEKKIYMPNITAESMEMLKRAKYVKEYGGEYIMVDILTAGWAGVQTVRQYNEGQVIHAHRAMHGALTRNPKHGMSMLTIAKLARLVGCDQLHVGTGVGKMEGSPTVVKEIAGELEADVVGDHHTVLAQEWYGLKPALAVSSGGLHPGHVPPLLHNMGYDIVAQFGGGCHGHPDGTTAGAKAIRQAVDAVMEGKSLSDYANSHMELQKALAKWGE